MILIFFCFFKQIKLTEIILPLFEIKSIEIFRKFKNIYHYQERTKRPIGDWPPASPRSQASSLAPLSVACGPLDVRRFTEAPSLRSCPPGLDSPMPTLSWQQRRMGLCSRGPRKAHAFWGKKQRQSAWKKPASSRFLKTAQSAATWWPIGESNPDQRLRRALLYPLS